MTVLIDTDIAAKLREVLADDAIDTDPAVLEAYSTDWTRIVPARPAAALVRPSTVEQVQATLRVASAHGVPVVVRGAGSGLAGGASAIPGGIVLSTERLDRIIEISPGDEVAVVQPGVITAHLDRAAGEFGLRYAPDPASSELSSIGGNIATNAGGLRCAKYGVTRESVLALDVVLADGTLLSVGHRSIKGVTGLDLVGLFVGSEGTLGVVVGATLRLRAVPVQTQTLVAFTDSLAIAGAAVEAIVLSGVQPSIVELLDESTLHNIDAHSGSDLAQHGRALLLIQTDGYGADREAQRLLEVTASVGAHARLVEGDEAERFVELRRSGRGPQPELWSIGEDVAVPRSRLVEMILAIEAIGAKHGLLVSTVAHAGDGNLHPGLSIAKRPGETEPPGVLEVAADELVRAALALGGTLTGEHGVGLVKRQWLAAELGDEQLALQRSIKQTFDPQNIFAQGFLTRSSKENQ